jgi:hypothetical protein
MSFATTKYWKRLNDDGDVISVYRRRLIDGIIRMDRYTYVGEWSDAYDYLLQAVEDPDFVEISAGEARRLLPKIARSRAGR